MAGTQDNISADRSWHTFPSVEFDSLFLKGCFLRCAIWLSCARLPPARSVLNITASRDVLILGEDISLKDERKIISDFTPHCVQ
jgi:hypothetical protein